MDGLMDSAPVAAEPAIAAIALPDYDRVSSLRQAIDRSGLLDWLHFEPRTMADLGCGTGSLLVEALDRFPRLAFGLGLDKLPSRLAEAAEKLRPFGSRAKLMQADLMKPPPLPCQFDFMCMTAVLHWLYPREGPAFTWIADHLAPKGSFLLTSYHPESDRDGLGGTDEIVKLALISLGMPAEDVSRRFDAAGIIPIARRTRRGEHLRMLLERRFRIRRTQLSTAVTRVRDGSEYQRYHIATFGTYYTRLVPAFRQRQFLDALGRVAVQRMEQLGFVTSMHVRRWHCMVKDA
jgi:SAM-dependent methyltransferase